MTAGKPHWGGYRMKRRTAYLIVAALLAAAACWAAGGLKLIVNGKVASSNIKMINGVPYAPLKDVAGAMNMVVVKRTGGYEITNQGGTYQVEGSRQGNIGDELFTGEWRFQVLKVSQTDEYQERYYGNK